MATNCGRESFLTLEKAMEALRASCLKSSFEINLEIVKNNPFKKIASVVLFS
jgi:hypothetical protein